MQDFYAEHIVYAILISGVQCVYHLREAHEIFVTGVEFAPTTASQAVLGPNVDFTLFSISADSQIKAHQLESRCMLLLLSFYYAILYRIWHQVFGLERHYCYQPFLW